eukprot:TRINITY_DN58522_c0_g1_i1.p1 TRINITY_DN58522_c0_g1~~TRINITY_DN58522_c0_g1_i1.p1  ORF type:complete len:466 (-),score=37.78 TRINITY_DN58522_c0_g1_i1:422-1819(-)
MNDHFAWTRGGDAGFGLARNGRKTSRVNFNTTSSSSFGDGSSRAPGHQTQARWRVDPLRESQWRWSCNQTKPATPETAGARMTAAIAVARKCVEVARWQARFLGSVELKKRRDGARYLSRLGPFAAAHVSVLVHALEDSDAEVRGHSLRVLGVLDPPVAALGRRYLGNNIYVDADVRKKAEHALSRVKSDPGPFSTQGTADARFRFTTAGGFGNSASASMSTMRNTGMSRTTSLSAASSMSATIALQLQDPSPATQAGALRKLRMIDFQAAKIPPWDLVDRCIQILSNERADDEVRFEAATTIGMMGEAAVAHVARHLDGDNEARRSGLRGLRSLGPAASAHAPAIVALLRNDPDPEVRACAASALTFIGNAAAVHRHDLAQSAEGDKDERVRKVSTSVLGGVVEIRDNEHGKSWRDAIPGRERGPRKNLYQAARMALSAVGEKLASLEHRNEQQPRRGPVEMYK